MLVRPMTRQDAGAVAVLCGQLGYPSTPEEIAARLAALVDRDTDYLVVADEEHGRTVAWAHARIQVWLEADPRAELLGLVVDEVWRGRGIGQALVAEVERWARARGMTRLRVRSNVIREHAHRFYGRLGFRVVKTQRVFERDLRPDRPA